MITDKLKMKSEKLKDTIEITLIKFSFLVCHSLLIYILLFVVLTVATNIAINSLFINCNSL